MRIAFTSIARFPCAVEIQRNPRLTEAPFIVGDAEQPRRVFDCSHSASAEGVRHGMTIRQALGNCPNAVILPPDPVLYRRKWEAITDELGNISPEVEDEKLGETYVNVDGLGSLYSSDDALAAHIVQAVEAASGLSASVGLAQGKFSAYAAASVTAPGEATTVLPGHEAAFLASLAVELLSVDPEIVFRLRLFGLETIGEVAELSLPELQSQFGFAGKRLWQLANGMDDEPLRPRPLVEKVETSLGFESPVAGVEVMVEAGKQLLSRLQPALCGRSARELVLQAELSTERGWERRIVLREAVSDAERLAFVLRSVLMNAPPPSAVRGLSLRLGGLTEETGRQLSLGERQRQQRQIEESIRQLKARYGYSPVYRCVDVEAWSVIPEERQILVESDG